MSKQTPEPWTFDDCEMKIKGSGDFYGLNVIANVSLKMDYSRGMATQSANAQRIVQCVNACAGMEDPAEEIERLRNRIKELEALK